MFKFLHAADLHLDSPFQGLRGYEGAPRDEIVAAGRRALKNLVQAAVDQRVAFVLIAGDVYDGDWRDYNTGLFFQQQMLRLRDAGIRVVLIRGNHDAANKMTKGLKLPDNVRLLDHAAAETVRFDDWGVVVHGQSFSHGEVNNNLALTYPQAIPGAFNIGLLHTSAEGYDGHGEYSPCKPADLHAKGYDYWALGHIHLRQRLHRDGEAPIHFSGNLQGRHIREQGAKGCLLVEVDDRWRVDVEFLPLDVFRWEQVVVNAAGAATIDDLLAQFDDELTRAWQRHERMPCAVRTIVRGRTKLHAMLVNKPAAFAAQIQSAALDVADGRVWIERVQLDTHPDQALDPEGPLGDLAAYLAELQADDDALVKLASELQDFAQKLPADLRERDDLRLDNPQRLRTLLAEVEPLLVARLLASSE